MKIIKNMTYEKLEKGEVIETSEDGTCQLVEFKKMHWIVLADNTVITPNEDKNGEAIFPNAKDHTTFQELRKEQGVDLSDMAYFFNLSYNGIANSTAKARYETAICRFYDFIKARESNIESYKLGWKDCAAAAAEGIDTINERVK